MTTLNLQIDVFTNATAEYDEDGYPTPTGSIEAAIIKAAADKLLGEVDPEQPKAEYGGRQKLRDSFRQKISEAIDARVEAVATAEIEAEVRRVLAEGWRKTSEYGEPKGDPVTLKSRVGDLLKKYEKDGETDYNGRRKPSALEALVKAHLDELLAGQFKPIVDAAKAKFTEAVDGVVSAKLTATLRESLGLR